MIALALAPDRRAAARRHGVAVWILPRRALLHRLLEASRVGIRRSAAARGICRVALRARPVITRRASRAADLSPRPLRSTRRPAHARARRRRFAQMLAGLATLGLMPAYLLLGNTLTTTLVRAVLLDARDLLCDSNRSRARIARRRAGGSRSALSLAFGAYAKYSMRCSSSALAIGLVATRANDAAYAVARAARLTIALRAAARRTSRGRPRTAGRSSKCCAATSRIAPSFQSGFALEYRNLARMRLRSRSNSCSIRIPLARAGLDRRARLRRFASPHCAICGSFPIAYVVLFVIAAALGAKGYYIVGVYASLLAIGAVAIEGAPRRYAQRVFALLVAVGILALPLSLPVLPVDGFVALHEAARLNRTRRNAAASDSAGFRRGVRLAPAGARRRVGLLVASRTASARARRSTPIRTATPGALDFFGRRYGLPPAISSQNTYYLWGTHGYDGDARSPSAPRASISCETTIAASCSCARRPNRTSGSSKAPRRSISAAIPSRRSKTFGRTYAGMARRHRFRLLAARLTRLRPRSVTATALASADR